MDRLVETKAADARLRKSTVSHARWMAVSVNAGLGDIPLAILARPAVSTHVRRRVASGRSHETVRDELRALREALLLAVRKGWWHGDPAEVCGGHPLQLAAEKRWLRAGEVKPFLDACKDPFHRLACEIALGTGLRVAEATNLVWRDWQRADGFLLIRPKTETGWQPKTSRERRVPVDDHLRTVLDVWRTRQLAKGAYGPDKCILPTRSGDRRSTMSWFAKKTREACVEAGVTVVSTHGLRHTFASLALEAGAPLLEVSRILGHYSPEFTARQYAHVSERRLQGVATMLRRHVASASETTELVAEPPGQPVIEPVIREQMGGGTLS
jgi:integrase